MRLPAEGEQWPRRAAPQRRVRPPELFMVGLWGVTGALLAWWLSDGSVVRSAVVLGVIGIVPQLVARVVVRMRCP